MMKIFTGKFFRNVWLFSVVVFLGNIAYVVFSPGEKNLPEDKILIPTIILFASVFIGSISFVFWILSIIDKRLSTSFEKYSSSRGKAVKIIKISLITLSALFVVLLLVITFLFSTTSITGDSMGGKYKDNSIQIICKICKEIKRGDVIIYNTIHDPDTDYIGRIVGLPNENITIEKGKLLVNGNILIENYADWSEWNPQEKLDIQLNDDEYFALFDRRKIYTESGEFINIHKFKKSSYIGKIL